MYYLAYSLYYLAYKIYIFVPGISTYIVLMSKKKIIFSIILCILSACYLSGNEVYYRSLGIKEGLSQPSAMSIWQDKLGRIWIGNDAVNCFNGNETKVFRLSQYFPAVEDSNIHHLCGTDSVVYFLAEDRVVYIDLYTDQPVLTNIRANAISVINNRLYAMNRHTVTMYDLRTNKKEEVFTDLNHTIMNISPIGNNQFWVGTTTGLLKVDVQKKKILSTHFDGEYIVSQFLDSSKRLWVGTQSKIAAFIAPDGQEVRLKNKTGFFAPYIYCFTEDRQGAVWMGTLFGAYKVVNNKEGVPELDESRVWMPETPITALYTDMQGTVWIGPYYGNIRYINQDTNNLTFYVSNDKIPEELHGVIMGAMTEDTHGNLFVAAEASGINVINENQPAIQHINAVSHALPSNKVKALWYDNEYSRLFVGLYKDLLFYLDKKTNRFEAIRSPLLEPYGQLTIEDMIPYKDKLILLTRNGIYKLDRRTLQVSRLFEEEELHNKCSGNIRTIYIDGKHRLWVSSLEEGLFTVDLLTQSLLYSYGDGLKKGSMIPSAVNAICGNVKVGLYMSTLSAGVLVYNEEKNEFKSLTRQSNLLLSDVCYNVALSAYDNLIITSDKGVSIIDITVKKEIGAAYHFHLKDLPLISGLGADCGIYVSPYTKKIYIGGLYGLLSFNEHDISQRENRYSLYFSSLVVNNLPVTSENQNILKGDIAFSKQIVLPYDQNTISLDFATTNYIPSNYTSYEYKMEGLDHLWITTDNNRITYSSLWPGKYRLMVRETENPQKEASLEIIIKRPYWLSWPAIFVYIGLIVLLSVWFMRFKKSKAVLKTSLEVQKKEKERMEKINQEKVTFLTNIANEFRAPLSIIITILNKIHAENESFARGRIGKVLKQSLYLQNQITRLLEFSRDEQNELHMETVQDMIQEYKEEEDTVEEKQSYTMLIVDSDSEIRSILKDTFSFAYKIIEAQNGDEGYTLATTTLPDIILSEISIPGISGVELCKMLKTNIEVLHIPVILLSCQPSDEEHTASVRAGADDYFVKPFRVELLLHRCNSLVRNRKSISQKYIQQAKDQPHELMATNKQDQLFLDSALSIIEANIENPDFDITLWSKSMGIGRTSLFNQIKSITGKTPNDYILSVKINKAMSLLQEEACYSVADIAYKLGYSDPTYFSRTFKKIIGLSPQQYRKEKNESPI